MEEFEAKILDCMRVVNTWNKPPANGKLDVWRVKDLFARTFPSIKDEINSL